MTANPKEVLILSLLRHELRSRRLAVLGWGIALSLFAVMYIGIYPQLGEQLETLKTLFELPMYKAFGMQMNSFEGFMASSVVQFIPIILAIYVIMASTETLAGEEDKGHLELLVSMPIKRGQIVLAKAIALALVTFMILVIAGASSAAALAWIKNLITVELTATQLFFGVLSAWPITLAVLMMGLFFSACMPNQRTAAMTMTTVYVVSYFGESLAALVDSLDTIKAFSLFSYFDSTADLFSEGMQVTDVAILLSTAAIFFGLALISFERRDITVGRWPWQHAKMGQEK